MPYTYQYPRPMVTADIFLLRLLNNELEILLIQRKNPPFKDKWALPGGYVEIDEELVDSALRELAEEAGLKDIPLKKFGVFGKPGRDPRGRTITVLFLGILPFNTDMDTKAGDDAANVEWFSLNHLPDLAFDHDLIIETSIRRFRKNCLLNHWFLLFLDKQEFSELEALKLIELLTGRKISPREIENLLSGIRFLESKSASTYCLNISREELLDLDIL
jgi:8-oxo-dGTP diphosphatase